MRGSSPAFVGSMEMISRIAASGLWENVLILSAWALDTDVILMDEPTANLDQGAISRLRGMLSELKAEGKTIVVSTGCII